MSRLVIVFRTKVIGVAHFIDDAMDCARRMSNTDGAFTSSGELISFDGTPTGYRIMKMETTSA